MGFVAVHYKKQIYLASHKLSLFRSGSSRNADEDDFLKLCYTAISKNLS
jgi:hypothetical protein